MKKALALCGGGGKGSFQIGAWKALREKKIDFAAVSGTSVGALNAVLYALGDFENAEKIWNGVNHGKMLSLNRDGTEGYFSRDGLREIFSELDLSKLDDCKTEVFATTYNIDKKRSEFFRLNGKTNDDKIAILLASSAMPVAYESVEIGGHRHMDGGYIRSENTPIEPLFIGGYRDIWIVALESDFNIYNIARSPLFRRPAKRIDIKHRYPDCDFEIIKPLRDISGFFNIRALDFSEKGIRNRLDAGYIDTIKILENEGIILKNNHSNINFAIRKKMQSLFKDQRELENFIKCTSFSNVNIEVQTMGGKVFWNNIAEIFGWVVQQRWKFSHYRILDHNHVRKAWTTDPMELLEALELYEKFRDEEEQND
ncbi:MAG: patatin-like phospholipase family protein [Defluviitaleaceae bacterium]|nr:patatin-like phospholipase family protein [Defluviitaleaceae bacterium]